MVRKIPSQVHLYHIHQMRIRRIQWALESPASGAELWVGGSLAPLCNAVVRRGAGLWLARSGQRRHHGRLVKEDLGRSC